MEKTYKKGETIEVELVNGKIIEGTLVQQYPLLHIINNKGYKTYIPKSHYKRIGKKGELNKPLTKEQKKVQENEAKGFREEIKQFQKEFKSKSSKYAKGSTVSSKMLEVGDMVKIMPSYPSQYTNSKGQIVKVMPNGKTYEVKIKHKSGNEYVRFEKSELVFLGYEPKYGNGGGVAVSSESGLAVGTNADLLMNQDYLQYADGGGVGEKKYLFESYYVTVNEDNFEEGESLEVFSQYEEKVGKVYNSMENLLRDMNRIMGTDYSKDDFDFETGEGRSIITDVLVDEDFIPPYANEVEKWRKGELKLYNAHYKFYVMPIYVADQYANGGNMSMGFNYSIGGL